jgi:hypothetical protein
MSPYLILERLRADRESFQQPMIPRLCPYLNLIKKGINVLYLYFFYLLLENLEGKKALTLNTFLSIAESWQTSSITR